MIYECIWPKHKHSALIATSDGVVVEAELSMKWAIGKRYETVESWTIGHAIKINLVSTVISLEKYHVITTSSIK